MKISLECTEDNVVDSNYSLNCLIKQSLKPKMNNDNPMLMKVEKVQMCQRSPHVDTAPEDR